MSDLDTEAIAAKVEARSLADEVFDFTMDEVRQAGLCVPAAEAFWRRLIDRIAQLDSSLIPKRIVERGPLAPMTDEEARTFAGLKMEWGKYQGTQAGDVQWDYLEWIDGLPDFRRQLNRYLRSEWVRRLREQEEPGDE